MIDRFHRIGLFAKPHNHAIQKTLKKLVRFLDSREHTLFFETQTATLQKKKNSNVLSAKTLGKFCDLVIVIGGDGSMLKAGRAIVNHETPILGINQGTIGFMADILPNNNMEKQLGQILNGEHKEDNRCLLSAKVLRNGKIISANLALNDIVLYNGNVARLINFKVFVDDQFVMHLRSDGLITATPTGSTAYALSAGGPILYPTLHNIVIVPMFPHTLTSRPIVLSENSTIRLVIPNNKTITPNLGCDGQTHLHLLPGDEVIIKKHAHKLRIIHPKDFNYFNLLREKLGFNTYIGSNRGHR